MNVRDNSVEGKSSATPWIHTQICILDILRRMFVKLFWGSHLIKPKPEVLKFNAIYSPNIIIVSISFSTITICLLRDSHPSFLEGSFEKTGHQNGPQGFGLWAF